MVDRVAIYVTELTNQKQDNEVECEFNDGDEEFSLNTRGLFLKYDDFEEIPNLDVLINSLDKPEQLNTVFVCGPGTETEDCSIVVSSIKY